MENYISDLAVTLADKVLEDERHEHTFGKCGYEQGCNCGLDQEYERLTDLFYGMIETVAMKENKICKLGVEGVFKKDTEWFNLVPTIKEFHSNYKE